MTDSLLHPLTKQALDLAVLSAHHSIAFIGPYGAGKGHLASELSKKFLGKGYAEHKVFRLTTTQSISIEEIRSLQSFLRLKTTGDPIIRRIVIVEDAQTLTVEAQNALLKTLEEPPADTKIILTVTDTNSLKKTVYSRLQTIHVQPCTKEQILAYFQAPKYNQQTVEKAYLISGGYIGLCSALITDSEHSLVGAIAEAKSYLSSTSYERLLKVETLVKDKEKVTLLLFATKRVLSAAMQGAKDDRTINSLISRMKVIYASEGSLQANPNMKLFLTDLSLAL